MSFLEYIAIISTIVCVILSAKERVSAWPVGIISAASLIGVYIPQHMYANIVLQGIFVIQCSIGWYNWGTTDNLKPSIQDKNQLVMDLMAIIGIGVVYSTVIIICNTESNWLYTYLDGLTTALALLGNWYLTKKRLQAWPLFMTYNVIIAVLFSLQGIYSLAALNLVLCCISFNGFNKWKRDLRKV